MSAGGADACLGCTYQREAWKMATDVAKLRRLVIKLRYCHTEGDCDGCPYAPGIGCHGRQLTMIDKVLAATAPKPKKKRGA